VLNPDKENSLLAGVGPDYGFVTLGCLSNTVTVIKDGKTDDYSPRNLSTSDQHMHQTS